MELNQITLQGANILSENFVLLFNFTAVSLDVNGTFHKTLALEV